MSDEVLYITFLREKIVWNNIEGLSFLHECSCFIEFWMLSYQKSRYKSKCILNMAYVK